MEAVGYVASFLMGITLGLLGGGGSILTVPIMVYIFGLAPTLSTGYSLFVVGITALVGAAMYVKKGEVDLRAGVSFAIPSIIGVNLARGLLVPRLPEIVLSVGDFVLTKEVLVMITFAALMIVASISMIKGRKEKRSLDVSAFTRTALIALQGGGFLIIPALVMLAGLSMRVAVGTSLTIIAVQSLFGFAGDVARGLSVDWSFLVGVAIVAVGGILVGSSFAHKIREQSLKITFGWFVLAMGGTILLEQIRHL
jgi:uncharacterized protein